MGWPSDTPRARFVRRWRWRLLQMRAELKAWFDLVLELDREQRRAFHDKVRSFLGFEGA